MNRLKFTLNPTKITNPVIEVSDNYEKFFIDFIKQVTSLEIDILKARKEQYQENDFVMVCYTFNSLSIEKAEELERTMKTLAIYFSEAINHSKN